MLRFFPPRLRLDGREVYGSLLYLFLRRRVTVHVLTFDLRPLTRPLRLAAGAGDAVR